MQRITFQQFTVSFMILFRAFTALSVNNFWIWFNLCQSISSSINSIYLFFCWCNCKLSHCMRRRSTFYSSHKWEISVLSVDHACCAQKLAGFHIISFETEYFIDFSTSIFMDFIEFMVDSVIGVQQTRLNELSFFS